MMRNGENIFKNLQNNDWNRRKHRSFHQKSKDGHHHQVIRLRILAGKMHPKIKLQR